METLDVHKVIAENFAADWLMVTMNNYEMYQELMSERHLDTVVLSEKLREEYNELVGQIVELVEEHISPQASDLVAQIMAGQGSYAFDLIAKEIKRD